MIKIHIEVTENILVECNHMPVIPRNDSLLYNCSILNASCKKLSQIILSYFLGQIGLSKKRFKFPKKLEHSQRSIKAGVFILTYMFLEIIK